MKYIFRHLEVFHFFVKSYFGREMTIFDAVYPEMDMKIKPSFFFSSRKEEQKIVEEFFD